MTFSGRLGSCEWCGTLGLLWWLLSRGCRVYSLNSFCVGVPIGVMRGQGDGNVYIYMRSEVYPAVLGMGQHSRENQGVGSL